MNQFTSDLVRAPASSPPGVTAQVAETLSQRLSEWEIAHEMVVGDPEQPNVMATIEAESAGPHLIYNVPLDTPVLSPAARKERDPFGGGIKEGRVYGAAVGSRACLSALAYALRFLASCRNRWLGKVTLTAVSQEGNFGPWGARYLLAQRPEVIGDAAIIGMATGAETVRFGEKGVVWANVHVQGKVSHAATPHAGIDAVKIGARLIGDLAEIETVQGQASPELAERLEATRELADMLTGKRTNDIALLVTTCASPVRGGLSHNKVPDKFDMSLDIRVPPGLTARAIVPHLERLVARYPEATIEITSLNDPSISDPDDALFKSIVEAGRIVFATSPVPTFSLPGSDARLWRYAGKPAAVFGPRAYSGDGDYVLSDDLLAFAGAYSLASLKYLGVSIE